MKKLMPLIAIIFSISFANTAYGRSTQFKATPLMGKYTVGEAKCGNETFLWKKHDKIIFSGSIFAIGGPLESFEDNKECRFQDVYNVIVQTSSFSNDQYSQVGTLMAEVRREACWDLVNGVRVGEPKVNNVDIVDPLRTLQAQKKGRTIHITIPERNLCNDDLTLELTH